MRFPPSMSASGDSNANGRDGSLSRPFNGAARPAVAPYHRCIEIACAFWLTRQRKYYRFYFVTL